MDKMVMFRHGLEVREESDEQESKRIIRGYPILFDELTDRAGYFKEKVDRHALDGVDLSDVVLLVGHNFDNLLARSGINLRLEVDDTGLFMEAELGDTEYDKLVYDRVKRGILDGMSFGFTIDELDTDYDNEIDTIKRIGTLYEVTLTPIPAYPQTIATAVERKAEHDEEMRKVKEAEEAAKRDAEEKAKQEELEKLAKELEEL